MQLTEFQKERASMWRWGGFCGAMIIAILLISPVFTVFKRTSQADFITCLMVVGLIFFITLLASFSRSLLGGYHYYVWEKNGQVTKWDNGIEPKEDFAIGLPTHGIGLKPYVIIPDRGDGGWSLRQLKNGDLLLRDREGSRLRFNFWVRTNAIEVATPVLQLLRDAYRVDRDGAIDKTKGKIWWAMCRREHRYWEAENGRRQLANAIELIHGRVAGPKGQRLRTGPNSKVAGWIVRFCRDALGVQLAVDDPRRQTLGVPENTSALQATLEHEIKQGSAAPILTPKAGDSESNAEEAAAS